MSSFWRIETWVRFASRALSSSWRKFSIRVETRRRWSSTSRKYSCSASGTTAKCRRRVLPALRQRRRRRLELEHLALELVDPLGRVLAFAEDLQLDFADVLVEALGGFDVAVDDVVDDRVEDGARSFLQQVGALLQALADRGQVGLAVAHRDHEVGGDEDRDLAELDHLFGVDVARGLDHHVDRVPVLLDLRPLVRPHRILDRQLVQPELGRDRLELLLARLDHAEPDESPLFLRRLAGPLHRELALPPPSPLVGRAVDDHRLQITACRGEADSVGHFL